MTIVAGILSFLGVFMIVFGKLFISSDNLD